MSVITKTTNETNTDESTSTLSFPNSSETEYTYNTNPTEFEVSTEVSSISAEVSSISTLVFPSGDGYNSILNFQSNETTSEDSSNSKLISQSEDVFNLKLSKPKLILQVNADNKFVLDRINITTDRINITTDRINIATDNSIIKPSVFPIVDNVVYDYYIKSINDYNNGMTDGQWWTSYQHEFIGDAILIIDKENGNQNGVCFIERSDIESSLQLNKHNLARNSIFTDKNNKDNLTDKARRYLYLRYIELEDICEGLEYKKNEFDNSSDRLNRYITNLEHEKKNHLNYCFEIVRETNLYKNKNRNSLSFLLFLFLWKRDFLERLIPIISIIFFIVWNYFFPEKFHLNIHPQIRIISLVLLFDFLSDFFWFSKIPNIRKPFYYLCKFYDEATISKTSLLYFLMLDGSRYSLPYLSLFIFLKSRDLLEILISIIFFIVWNYFFPIKFNLKINQQIRIISCVLLLDFLLDYFCFSNRPYIFFHDDNTISSIPNSHDFSIYDHLPCLILWLFITVFNVLIQTHYLNQNIKKFENI